MDAVGKYNTKLIAIRHPKLYVFLRPLHDLRNSAKPVASNILKKISPRYRQRLETIKTINKLNEIQSELSVKISEIELKIEEENGKK